MRWAKNATTAARSCGWVCLLVTALTAQTVDTIALACTAANAAVEERSFRSLPDRRRAWGVYCIRGSVHGSDVRY